jgi:2-oxoisovalerate dehydrogenase E2 component (dihydrolipoyl transacylase)
LSQIRDFRLPDLGEGLEEGEIVAWHVEVGDVIELNQTVADVETEKAVVEVPSPYAGRVVERLGEVGEALPVGSVFLRVDVEAGAASPGTGDDEGGAAPDDGHAAQARAGSTPAGALDADEEPQPLVGYGQGKAGPPRRRRRRGGAEAATAPAATPLAKPPVRKLAKDLGVDLAALAPGSGPDGVITREDVQAAATSAPSEPDVAPAPAPRAGPAGAGVAATPVEPGAGFRGRRPGEVEPMRGVRGRIASRMETSRREIPEATCSRDADLTELWELRADLTELAASQGYEVRITPFAVVMRATIIALRRFPTLNARIVGREGDEPGEIQLLEHINLGFAADTERGLLVPNIKDAHDRSLLELAVELDDLARRARDGSLTPTQLTGGTFTVNNYGAFGNDDGDPIINHPEAGILGLGAIRERPWVLPDGSIAARRVARFTLAFDHRVCDGGEAGRFVTYVAHLCEHPARLLLHA